MEALSSAGPVSPGGGSRPPAERVRDDRAAAPGAFPRRGRRRPLGGPTRCRRWLPPGADRSTRERAAAAGRVRAEEAPPLGAAGDEGVSPEAPFWGGEGGGRPSGRGSPLPPPAPPGVEGGV